MEKMTKEKRSNIMRAIKSKGTKDEVVLAKALWSCGLRYRKNNNTVFGKPDITFKQYRIAIFIDGEFFHGYNWDERKNTIFSNREYWIPKIERNIQRDKEVNQHLISNGWVVIRFWSAFLKKNLASCVELIQKEINLARTNNQ